jgi:hypothetical protein
MLLSRNSGGKDRSFKRIDKSFMNLLHKKDTFILRQPAVRLEKRKKKLFSINKMIVFNCLPND